MPELKPGDSIKYAPKINFKAQKGETSFGVKTVSELLNHAERFTVLVFTDENGQLWQLKKVK